MDSQTFRAEVRTSVTNENEVVQEGSYTMSVGKPMTYAQLAALKKPMRGCAGFDGWKEDELRTLAYDLLATIKRLQSLAEQHGQCSECELDVSIEGHASGCTRQKV